MKVEQPELKWHPNGMLALQAIVFSDRPQGHPPFILLKTCLMGRGKKEGREREGEGESGGVERGVVEREREVGKKPAVKPRHSDKECGHLE